MTFWTESTLNPTRQFRFMVSNGVNWWWVSSCSKPSYEISTEEYKLINHKFKYPGVATWNDVTLTIVDVSGQTNSLLNYILENGHDVERAYGSGDGLSKSNLIKGLYDNNGFFHIKQLNEEGAAIETWSLKNAFIKSTNFGQLDYTSDELVKLELVISYDYAILE